ncbi:MAG: hypothetical protein N2037_10990 [Acidimicrobiales bacterium]|nr:hypothetical protein [Acidimicrobiales bacterium]
MRWDELPRWVESCLRERFDAPDLVVVELRGRVPESDELKTSWRDSKYSPDRVGDLAGVLPIDVVYRFDPSLSGPPTVLPLILKARTEGDGVGDRLIPQIIRDEHLSLPRPLTDYQAMRALLGTSAREIRLYELQESYEPLQDFLPHNYGTLLEPGDPTTLLMIERITEPMLLDRANDLVGWNVEAVRLALGAMGTIHGQWFGKQPDLEKFSWLPRRIATADLVADRDLWDALVELAKTRFAGIASDESIARRKTIIDSIEDWHPIKDAFPHTLAHNDFNPRNVCFRRFEPEGPVPRSTPGLGSPVIYDWELTIVDVPQRDLAEMLTFTMLPGTPRSEVDELVDHHRWTVEKTSGITIDRELWFEIFRVELKLEAINRVGLQLLFATELGLPYVPRIYATIDHLLDLYE